MFNRKKLYLFFLALALTMTGCGGGAGGSSGAAAPTTGTVSVVNNGSLYGIDEVYVSLSTNTSWGAKQNSSAIAPGASWNLTNVPVGTYDSSIVSLGTTSTYYAYKLGFAVTAGGTYTLTATDSSYTGTLQINNNNATYAITAVYVSATSYGGGTNQITSNIAPGTSRQIIKIPAGSYYVRVVMNGVNTDGVATIASHSYTPVNII